MSSIYKSCCLACPVFVGGALSPLGGEASAAMITLSTHSSDETPAADLDATFEFTVTGSTLTLTVTNTTSAPSAYKINEIYFNVPVGISLTFAGLPAWSMSTGVAADGFGVFSIGVIDGQGNNPHQLLAGESEVFTFTISGGSAVDTDFISYFSAIPPGDTPAIAVAKFVGGPGDDSAFGAFIPAPGGAILLLTPIALGRRRR